MEMEHLFNDQVEKQLFDDRTLFVSEAINARVAKKVINTLLAMETKDPGKDITFYINSPGGEVNSGFAIFDVMRFISSNVKVVSAGLCASIATVINVGADKGNRYSLPNSKFLIHQPLIHGHVQGQASDLEITAKEIMKTREKINQLLAKECGQTIDKVAEDTNRDYWMSADEALKYGLIDKVISLSLIHI